MKKLIIRDNTPVTAENLDNFRNDILDATTFGALRKNTENPYRMLVVSNTSFSEDSLEYVKSKKNQIKNKAFDLIFQQDNQYKIVYIS